jgi:uncharacterized protein YbjT (DUF2867 family)
MPTDILITGATGNVGSEVVKGLMGRVPFRIGARDIAQSQKLLGEQNDIVLFDFLNPDTFMSAFAGIKTLFLVRPPALSNVKRDIAPALYAAVQAGVSHIVFLSLQGVESNQITPHYKIEMLIRELGVTYTFLRASFFMQNLSTVHHQEIRDHDVIAVPVGRAKTSFVDVRDIASVAVYALTQSKHENKIYTLTGQQALDYDQVAAALSHELGRPIRYTNPSAITFLWRQMRAGQPLGVAVVMTALYTITRWGNAKEVTSDVAAVLKRPPLTFEQFAHDYRAHWIK